MKIPIAHAGEAAPNPLAYAVTRYGPWIAANLAAAYKVGAIDPNHLSFEFEDHTAGEAFRRAIGGEIMTGELSS